METHNVVESGRDPQQKFSPDNTEASQWLRNNSWPLVSDISTDINSHKNSTGSSNFNSPGGFIFGGIGDRNSQSNMNRSIEDNNGNESLKKNAKLIIAKQPEEQHRARYLSEGSRGAIKDRNGSSHCTIQLTGYYRPTRVEIFAAHGAGELEPHPLYKLIPVSGKTPITTPCTTVTAHDGIDCLQVTLRPENQMTAVLDCMGILKICSYDARQQKRQRRSTSTTSKRQKSQTPNDDSADSQISTLASTCTRICFRAYILDESKSNITVLKSFTEPIRCVQQLGVPEVLKMSLSSAPARGGMDLFIIGRNFDRNTTVLFREYTDEGTVGWSSEAAILKPYFHQCHIVCTVPRYPNLYRGGTVSITVKCGQKSSHPTNFTYTPVEEQRDQDEWAPPASPRFEVQRPQNRGNNHHNSWAPPISIQSTYFNHFNDDSTTISPTTGTTSTSKLFLSTYFDYDHNDQGFVPDYSNFDRYDNPLISNNPTSAQSSTGQSDCKRQRMDF